MRVLLLISMDLSVLPLSRNIVWVGHQLTSYEAFCPPTATGTNKSALTVTATTGTAQGSIKAGGRPITQIGDGQIQAPTALPETIASTGSALTSCPASKYEAGFTNVTVGFSVGGKAICVNGKVPVSVSATNSQLQYTGPANQIDATSLIVDYLTVNSTLPAKVVGAKRTFQANYFVDASLCYPVNGCVDNSTIQILSHGVGFDKSYWDFYNETYSYVDHAALAGYTTFAYSRLGTGESSHPDPIQDVQAPAELQILHTLIGSLKSGAIASTSFSKIIGVGHSFGSLLTAAVTSQYPKDLTAAVLTGFSLSIQGQGPFFAGLNLAIANLNNPFRFSRLPNGYLVSDTAISNQFGFFHAPGFDPQVLYASEATKQTFTIGELFSVASLSGGGVSPFTGPVDVVDGQFDLPFCQGDCLAGGKDQAAAVGAALYPHSSNFQSYVAAGAGHGLNLHYSAPLAYDQINGFLKSNGL